MWTYKPQTDRVGFPAEWPEQWYLPVGEKVLRVFRYKDGTFYFRSHKPKPASFYETVEEAQRHCAEDYLDFCQSELDKFRDRAYDANEVYRTLYGTLKA